MIPGVSVAIVAGNGGQNYNISDGVAAVVLTGAGTGTIGLLQPFKVLSLADGVSQGITQAAEPEAYKTISEFYLGAPAGSPLYAMLAANTASLVSLLDVTNLSGAKKLVDFGQGTIRGLGVMRTPAVGYTPTTDEFIDTDAHAALVNALAFQQAYFAAHTPLSIFIGARVADETSATIYTPTSAGNNAVSLVIGDTVAGGKVGMGIILGRFAATSGEVNIGRVKDGSLNINAWYIGSKPITPVASGAWYQALNSLINAGYTTVTTYAQKAGFYISDDPLCTTGDLTNINNLSDRRVADDASIVAYQTYINELKDNVDLQPDGTIDPLTIKDLEAQITNNINLNMGTKISSSTVYINPAQSLSGNTPFVIQLGVTRKGTLRSIQVQLAIS